MGVLESSRTVVRLTATQYASHIEEFHTVRQFHKTRTSSRAYIGIKCCKQCDLKPMFFVLFFVFIGGDVIFL